jgi:hypothetical protein
VYIVSLRDKKYRRVPLARRDTARGPSGERVFPPYFFGDPLLPYLKGRGGPTIVRTTIKRGR